MVWAYVLENLDFKDIRSNQDLFLLIKDLGIVDDNLFFDSTLTRSELQNLLEQIQAGDRLAIRSVEDLADTLSDLTCVLQKLTDKQVILCSFEEPYFSGEDYLESLNSFIKLYVSYEKKKQRQAYQQAVAEGKVGRPAKTKEVAQALAMYQSGKFKLSQIEAVTGVSKSTIYRYLDKDK